MNILLVDIRCKLDHNSKELMLSRFLNMIHVNVNWNHNIKNIYELFMAKANLFMMDPNSFKGSNSICKGFRQGDRVEPRRMYPRRHPIIVASCLWCNVVTGLQMGGDLDLKKHFSNHCQAFWRVINFEFFLNVLFVLQHCLMISCFGASHLRKIFEFRIDVFFASLFQFFVIFWMEGV